MLGIYYHFNHYFADRSGAKYWDCMSLCFCVCLCLLAYLKNHMSKLREVFCAYYLWSWLGPPLMTA